MITHTTAAPRLLRYNTAVDPSATVTVETIQVHPNSGLCVVAAGDVAFTLRLSQLDLEDGATFDPEEYPVEAGGSIAVYFRGGAGACLIEIANGAGALEPDVRVYGMSQP